MNTQELVPSVSIENLIAKRNAAAERIRGAHKLLTEANDLNRGFFGGEDVYEMWKMRLVESGERHDFTADDGAERQIKRMDAHYWDALLKRSGLMTFMDAETREKWREKIRNADVPELTAANIDATFTQLYGARGSMFEDGVVSFFRKLSFDFKTNTPVKLGKRIVLTHAVGSFGHGGGKRGGWTTGIEHEAGNKLDDIIRVMSVLEGKPEPDHRDGAYYKLTAAQWMKDGSDVNVAEIGDYVSIRGFKNGNAHVTFLKPALVEQLNKIIAKRYPRALPCADSDA